MACLVLLATGPSFAQTFPPFTGLVVDAANVIPPDREAALTAKLQALQQQTGRQVVVATIASLQNYPIEDYGYRLGRSWGVGAKGADNGVILFVAPNEAAGRRGPRIEVGRRLEPIVTDALSSVIIRTRMMPLLRSGDLPGALDAGADALITQLRLPDAQAQAENAKAAAAFDRTRRRGSGGDGVPLGLIFWGLVAGFILLSAVRRRSGGGGGARAYQSGDRRGGGSDWPIWLWAASELMSSRHSGRGGGWGSGSGGGGGGSDGSWMGGGFTGGGGGDFGGGGASGDW